MFVESFVNGTDWADEVTALERMSKLTKADIVAFANKYFTDSNYAVVYKKTGKDPNEKKISKPEITPIVMNRDTASEFLKEISLHGTKRFLSCTNRTLPMTCSTCAISSKWVITMTRNWEQPHNI